MNRANKIQFWGSFPLDMNKETGSLAPTSGNHLATTRRETAENGACSKAKPKYERPVTVLETWIELYLKEELFSYRSH